MTKIIYRPEAVSDIQTAFDWYERQRQGLGDEFLEELRESEAVIQGSPTAFRIVHRSTHRYLVRRFPYQVLYRVVNDMIVVLGCLHVRRSPRLARKRIDG